MEGEGLRHRESLIVVAWHQNKESESASKDRRLAQGGGVTSFQRIGTTRETEKKKVSESQVQILGETRNPKKKGANWTLTRRGGRRLREKEKKRECHNYLIKEKY